MRKNELSTINVVEVIYNGKKVITTEQLANVYETEVKNIQMNFKRNEDKFTEGVHYYLLEGAELKAFKNCSTVSGSVNKHTRNLILWTHRGASRHCKILDTNKAWDQFDALEDVYFNKVNNSLDNLSPYIQALVQMDVKQREMEEKIMGLNQKVDEVKEVVEERFDNFTEILSLNKNNWRKDANRLINQIAFATGDPKNVKDIRKAIYNELDSRMHTDIQRRLLNMQKNSVSQGVSISKAKKLNFLDVIEADPKLIEGYCIIVKELAISSNKMITDLETIKKLTDEPMA